MNKNFQFKHIVQKNIKFPQCVLIDYDNTLVDSWMSDFRLSNRILKALGHATLSKKMVGNLPEIPIIEAICSITKKTFQEVKDLYDHFEATSYLSSIKIVPGAEELLNYMKNNKIFVAIISNKEEDSLMRSLIHLGWKKYVDKIVGAVYGREAKPSPEIIKEATKERHFSKERMWMVGDSFSTDILCAQRAGIMPVWVSQYSKDRPCFSENGIPLIKVKTCYDILRLLHLALLQKKSMGKNSLNFEGSGDINTEISTAPQSFILSCNSC